MPGDTIQSATLSPDHPVAHPVFQPQKGGLNEESKQVDDYFRDTLDSALNHPVSHPVLQPQKSRPNEENKQADAEPTSISEVKTPKTISRTLQEKLDELDAQCDQALKGKDEAALNRAVQLARDILVLMLSKEAKFNHDDLEKITRRVEIVIQKICRLHTDSTTIALKYLGAAISIIAGGCHLVPLIGGVAGLSEAFAERVAKIALAGDPLNRAVNAFEGTVKASTDAAMTGADHERNVANELHRLMTERDSTSRSSRAQYQQRNSDAEKELHQMIAEVLRATQA